MSRKNIDKLLATGNYYIVVNNFSNGYNVLKGRASKSRFIKIELLDINLEPVSTLYNKRIKYSFDYDFRRVLMAEYIWHTLPLQGFEFVNWFDPCPVTIGKDYSFNSRDNVLMRHPLKGYGKLRKVAKGRIEFDPIGEDEANTIRSRLRDDYEASIRDITLMLKRFG